MTNQQKVDFFELLKFTGAAYGKRITPDLARAYWSVLSGYDFGQLEFAFTYHITNEKFFPRISEIVELLEARPASSHDAAIEAWAELFSTPGRIAEPAGDHARKALRMIGGANMLSRVSVSNLPFERQRFIECYKSSLETSVAPIRALPNNRARISGPGSQS